MAPIEFNSGFKCLRTQKKVEDLTQSYDKNPYTNRKFENMLFVGAFTNNEQNSDWTYVYIDPGHAVGIKSVTSIINRTAIGLTLASIQVMR